MDRPCVLEERKEMSEFEREIPGLWRAIMLAVLGGFLIGGIGAGFRFGLDWLGDHYLLLMQWAHGFPWIGWVVPVLFGTVGAGLARWLVRSQPLAAGSGVHHVEAIMRKEAEPASLLIVPIKFFGGLLAMGSGLALGREGPTIQMGATIGAAMARWFHCAKDVMRDLQAALGGAGLAVAFNAPLGGALFVFEEVAHTFRLRLTVVTLAGTATAIMTARGILGNQPDFSVGSLPLQEPWTMGIYLAFGGLMGVSGVLYNKSTLSFLNLMEHLGNWPSELRAGLIGAMVGIVAWFSPTLVGGGDLLSQEVLNGGLPVASLILMLLVRWVIGPLSYAAGTPGGLFSPLLLVGAVLGALFAMAGNAVFPSGGNLSVAAFAIVGMTALFTGIVRAPITGVILIAEMTATTSLFVPMVVAALGAMVSSSLMRGEPIYDTLRKRLLASSGFVKPRHEHSARKYPPGSPR